MRDKLNGENFTITGEDCIRGLVQDATAYRFKEIRHVQQPVHRFSDIHTLSI
jgi:hypothetical protein